MSNHIIDNVVGWRETDYDGYNDYFVDNYRNIHENELEK